MKLILGSRQKGYVIQSIKWTIVLFVSLSSYVYSNKALARAGWESASPREEIVKIKTSFGHCTGTRVSNQGHILTARHCLNACLIQSDSIRAEALFPEEGWRSPNLYHFTDERDVHCEAEINGVPKVFEVLAASTGFMTPSEQGSLSLYASELHQRFLDSGYFHNGDFALIKVAEFESSRCLQVSDQELSLSAPVHYFGYPGDSSGRPERRNSDGESFYQGEGEVISSILENPCIKGSEEALINRYDRDELILSTVDILPGASGSSLLNHRGEIVGLLNSSYTNGAQMFERYCRGSAVALSMVRIKETLLQDFPSLDLGEVFHCSND